MHLHALTHNLLLVKSWWRYWISSEDSFSQSCFAGCLHIFRNIAKTSLWTWTFPPRPLIGLPCSSLHVSFLCIGFRNNHNASNIYQKCTFDFHERQLTQTSHWSLIKHDTLSALFLLKIRVCVHKRRKRRFAKNLKPNLIILLVQTGQKIIDAFLFNQMLKDNCLSIHFTWTSW